MGYFERGEPCRTVMRASVNKYQDHLNLLLFFSPPVRSVANFPAIYNKLFVKSLSILLLGARSQNPLQSTKGQIVIMCRIGNAYGLSGGFNYICSRRSRDSLKKGPCIPLVLLFLLQGVKKCISACTKNSNYIHLSCDQTPTIGLVWATVPLRRIYAKELYSDWMHFIMSYSKSI